MATKATESFGRYLRALRERRGLSLNKVKRLSQDSGEPIDKGTLSRYEHGRQCPAVFKLVPLSRIYAVPADVLLERMELDSELDRVGGPKTEALSFSALQALGKRAMLQHSRKWDAYAYLRDALLLHDRGCGTDDTDDRTAAARMNFITSARSLGRNRFARHELEELETSGAVSPRRRAILFERLSNCHRCLGEYAKGERYAASAIEHAREFDEPKALAYAYLARANLALDQSRPDGGTDDLVRAFRAFRDAGDLDCLLSSNPAFEATTLNLIAERHFDLGNHEQSKRAALAAKRLGRRSGVPAPVGYSELMLGRLDEVDGRAERAIGRWLEATRIAGRIGNKRLRFSGEFFVFRHAVRQRDRATARASGRRLERLAPWVPRHLVLLREFEHLADENRSIAGRRAIARRSPAQELRSH